MFSDVLGRMKVSEVMLFFQTDLGSGNVYLLDTSHEVLLYGISHLLNICISGR